MTLSASDVLLVVLMDQSVSKRTISHCMLIHVIILEVRHHICKSRLCCWFCSLLLDFVHLFQVFLGCRIQFWAKAFLCLQWPSFRFRDLIDLEATTHGRMHHDFAWSLDFLQAVECDVIEVACTVEISLFVSHNLLKEMVTASLSLFLLKQQVISRCNLIMLIILNIRYSLCQVAIRANTRGIETVLNLA